MKTGVEMKDKVAATYAFTQFITELYRTRTAGSWRQDRRFKTEVDAMLSMAEQLRSHADAEISMYGFRVQMLITEFMEMDSMYHEKVIHLREVRNQEELLQLSFYRTNEAYAGLQSNKEADSALRKLI